MHAWVFSRLIKLNSCFYTVCVDDGNDDDDDDDDNNNDNNNNNNDNNYSNHCWIARMCKEQPR